MSCNEAQLNINTNNIITAPDNNSFTVQLIPTDDCPKNFVYTIPTSVCKKDQIACIQGCLAKQIHSNVTNPFTNSKNHEYSINWKNGYDGC